MGKFVQNKSMDTLMSILQYFHPTNGLTIINSAFAHNKSCIQNTTKFTGEIKDFTVLKLESGEIKFADAFDILNINPDKGKITVYIYEY